MGLISSDGNRNPERIAAGQSVGGGRFVLQRCLGQGGMGVVWLADDRLLREPVALKFLPNSVALDPAALAGLRRETARARRLTHPNIVRVHDLIDPPNEPWFICMEWVDGSNLHAVQGRHPAGVLRWDYLEPLMRQAAGALEYAHGEGIVHHDIKPSNLLLQGADRLKLADFGLARLLAQPLSRPGHAAGDPPGPAGGTLEYMSPQQADGRPPHPADDIYSLGATFY